MLHSVQHDKGNVKKGNVKHKSLSSWAIAKDLLRLGELCFSTEEDASLRSAWQGKCKKRDVKHKSLSSWAIAKDLLRLASRRLFYWRRCFITFSMTKWDLYPSGSSARDPEETRGRAQRPFPVILRQTQDDSPFCVIPLSKSANF